MRFDGLICFVKHRIAGLPALLLPFLLFGCYPSLVSGQQETDLIVEDLERRAREVTFQYPWLIQNYSGLSISAYDVPRDEFLRGINAATDLVFEGTENLSVRVSLVGRYPNIQGALNAVCREDPQLDCKIDFSILQASFERLPDDTAGLSDVALITRYRQVKVNPTLIHRNYGMYFGGMLIVNGSQFPPPFEFQIEPFPTESRVAFNVNGFPVTEYIYTDPATVDQSLYQATTADELKSALQNKLDQSWRMTSRFQLAATPEMLSLLSQQAQFLYGVVRSEPMIGGLRLHLNEGSHLDWSLPKSEPTVAFDGADAYQKAVQLQNQIVGGLSVGGVVFLSNRFGNHILKDPMTFQQKMSQILSNEGELRTKEKEIRIYWHDESEWVLEYFYTSLVPDTWMESQPVMSELIPNSDNLGPVFEKPVMEQTERPTQGTPEPYDPVTLPSDLLPLEIPSRGRGLVVPPESEQVERVENSEIYFENENEEEKDAEQPDSQP